ncbi:hypothetical protein DL98DRAFT_648602 [Cadophora sp. DSE1049]|nr:hypothetical protein DL98DRAFT_648602 [Cadophora sp. DSE1049]
MSQRTIHDDTSPLPPPPAGSSLNLNSSLNSSPSTTPSLSGKLPPPPTKPHRTWHPIYIHSAKCDGCHTKKHKVLQRCDGCTLQYCQSCMPKAVENAHEYDESKLDWDPSQKSPTFRDRSSMKKKRERGEKLPPRSRLGAIVVGDDEEEEGGNAGIETLSEGAGKSGSSVRGSARGDSRGSSYRGTGRPSERLLTEAEKYHPQVRLSLSVSDDFDSDVFQGYGAAFTGGRDGGRGDNGPEYGRYASQEMALGEDDGYSTPLHPTKRQRKDGPNLERSVASKRFEDQRFNNQIFDSPRIGRTQTSSSSIRGRPSIRQQPPARQQQASMASVASSRREPIYPHQQEEQNSSQIRRSTVRRAAPMLRLDSTFEDATDAVMKVQEDQENLPRRRREFEEYCKERWQNEPILKQLRKEGQDGEAEELWLASKAALYVAYRLGDEFGRDDA